MNDFRGMMDAEVLDIVFATMERVEILDHVDQLIDMIMQSDEVENYHRCRMGVQRDEEAQQLIRSFIKMKEQYEDVQRFGKYHPEYKKMTTEIRTLKRELDLHDSIAAYKMAEQDVQELLDDISRIIGKSVSDYIKVPTGNPFFDTQSSCGGGCGSGGSCSCSTG